MPKKRKAPVAEPVVVEVPVPPAPAAAPPPQPPPTVAPADPAAGLRGSHPPVANPVEIDLPDTPEAIINNVLCREINDPTPTAESTTTDPNIHVLGEIAKGISCGTDINHVKDDALRIAAHQPEKVNIVKALIRGIDINRLTRFVMVRDKAETELARAAMRGDLRSTEYLSFLRWSASEVKQITADLNLEDMHRNGGGDSAGMLAKMDYTQQAQEAEANKQYKGTTPQGREIIRRQIYDLQSNLKKAGKMKTKDVKPGEPEDKKSQKAQQKDDRNGNDPKKRRRVRK